MAKQHLYYLLVALSLLGYSCKTHAPRRSNTSKLTQVEKVEYDKLFFNACAEKVKGNADLANALFLQCIKKDSTNPTAFFEVAKYLNLKGDKNNAIRYAAKAVELDPQNVWFKYYYAEYLVGKNQYAKAAEVYKQLTVLEPGKIELLYGLGEMYVYSNQFSEALKVYDDIEKKIGVNEEGSMQRIKIFNAQKNNEKVIHELGKLTNAFPKEAKYYGMLGEAYQSIGQNTKAIETFNELLKVDPNNPFVHLSLAQYNKAKNDEWGAIHEYKLAFQNPSLDIDTKMKVLLSYYSITEHSPIYKDSVLELCKVMVSVHPDEAKSYAILGDFEYREKDYPKARDAFRQALARDKTKYIIWNTLMVIDSELNDNESLLADSKQSISLFPAEPLGYLFNGFALAQKKEYEPAIKILNDGKELVVDNKPLLMQFYSSLGDAYESIKRYGAADTAYDNALSIDSNNVNVLNNYAYYLSLRKVNLEKALVMSKRVNDIQPKINSYLDTYGWIFYQQGNYSEAKHYIGDALQFGGAEHGVILEHYGDILFRLNDQTGALEYWNKAKQKGGGSEYLDQKIKEGKLYE